MLPGVEVARKRRLHHHHDMIQHRGTPSSPSGTVQTTSMDDVAIAARRRLEDKLRRSQLSRLGMAAEKSHSVGHVDGRRERSLSALAVAAGRKMVGWRSSRASSAETCLVCPDEAVGVEIDADRDVHLQGSQKYHFDCLAPWLGTESRCPCCSTLVPSLHAIS